MEGKTKIVLTVIGLAAIIVPAVLLIVFSGRGSATESSVAPAGGTRPLRQDAVQEEVDKSPERTVIASPIASPSPSPIPTPRSSPSTPPLEASGSGGVN